MSSTETQFLTCIKFFEQFSISSCQQLINFSYQQIRSNNLLVFEHIDKNTKSLTTILDILSICAITSETASAFVIDSNNIYTQILQFLSYFKDDNPTLETLLKTIFIFIAISIWDSKDVAKYTITKLSTIQRSNGETFVQYLSSLAQNHSDVQMKGISSLILLGFLAFLSKKLTFPNLLQNNVDRYARLLSSQNDNSFISQFIRKAADRLRENYEYRSPTNSPTTFKNLQQIQIDPDGEFEFSEVSQFRERISELEQENDQLKYENQALTMKESEYSVYRDKLLDAKIELLSLRKENKRLTELQNGSHSEIKFDNTEIVNLDEVESQKQEIAFLKKQIVEKDQQLNSLTSSKLKQDFDEAKNEIEQLKTLNSELSIQIEALKQELDECNHKSNQNSFDENEDLDSKLRGQIFDLSSELEKLRNSTSANHELDYARKEILVLQTQISELKNLSQSSSFIKDRSPVIAKSDNHTSQETIQTLQLQLKEKDLIISNLTVQLHRLGGSNSLDQTLSQDGISSTVDELTTKLGQTETELNSLRSIITQKDEELEQFKNSTNSPVLNRKDPQVISIAKQFAKMQKLKEKFHKENEALKKSEKEKDIQLESLRSQIKIFQQLRVTDTTKDTEILRLQTQLENIHEAEEEKESRFQAQISQKEKEINSLKAEISILKNNSKDLDQKLKEKRTKHSDNDLNQIITEKDAKIAQLKSELEAKQAEKINQTRIDQLNKEINSLQTTIKEQKARIAKLELNSAKQNDSLFLDKEKEIQRLNLLVADQLDKIDKLTAENNLKSDDYSQLEQKCKYLQDQHKLTDLNQYQNLYQQQKLESELEEMRYKYEQLNEQIKFNSQDSSTFLQTQYDQLEEKHQKALKVIGKLWARNQSLISENSGQSTPNQSLNAIDSSMLSDVYQFL